MWSLELGYDTSSAFFTYADDPECLNLQTSFIFYSYPRGLGLQSTYCNLDDTNVVFMENNKQLIQQF